jgi:hypothetical protein
MLKKLLKKVAAPQDKGGPSRRKFLTGAAAATGAAMAAFPMFAGAQDKKADPKGDAKAPAAPAAPAVVSSAPGTMRWQSTWPAKDIFHEYALDFAKKVNDATGGELKIEVLPAGAVVPAFGLLDAVSKGTLDGGHGVLVYHYGKNNALGAVGIESSIRHGRADATFLAQVRLAAKRCLKRSTRTIGANVVSLPLRADADAALWLVQETDYQAGGLQGSQVPHRGYLH